MTQVMTEISSTAPSRRAAVYRLYDAAGTLLYIGSAYDPDARWAQHKTTKEWWSDVVSHTLAWQPSREQAFAVEAAAIRAEKPKHNQVGIGPSKEPQPITAEEQRAIDEKVRQVFDLFNAVDTIADPEARSRAQIRTAAEVRERSAKWNAERAELAQQMQADGESVRGIAKRLGIKPGTVQDLLRGYKGSGRNRPRAEQEDQR